MQQIHFLHPASISVASGNAVITDEHLILCAPKQISGHVRRWQVALLAHLWHVKESTIQVRKGVHQGCKETPIGSPCANQPSKYA